MKYDVVMSEDLFREKLLRDTAYVVFAPLILKTDAALRLQAKMRDAVGRFLEREPERLFRMVARPEPRLPLGKWFERLFFAALKITFPFAEVLHSVRDEAGGELDFLIIENHLTTHIECAVKFFLHQPTAGSGLASYVGPGGQDRLDLKFLKMRDVQLARAVPDLYVPDGRVRKVLWMSGRIHEPLSYDGGGQPREAVPLICRDAAKGYWGTIGEVLATKGSGEELYLLPRQWWVTDLTGLARSALAVFETLSSPLPVSEPMMTALVRVDGDHVVELARGFVMA